VVRPETGPGSVLGYHVELVDLEGHLLGTVSLPEPVRYFGELIDWR
jgi:hypothetical protein